MIPALLTLHACSNLLLKQKGVLKINSIQCSIHQEERVRELKNLTQNHKPSLFLWIATQQCRDGICFVIYYRSLAISLWTLFPGNVSIATKLRGNRETGARMMLLFLIVKMSQQVDFPSPWSTTRLPSEIKHTSHSYSLGILRNGLCVFMRHQEGLKK